MELRTADLAAADRKIAVLGIQGSLGARQLQRIILRGGHKLPVALVAVVVVLASGLLLVGNLRRQPCTEH